MNSTSAELETEVLRVLEHVLKILEGKESRRIVRVEASAGSGKTFLLTLIYITIALYGKLKKDPEIDFSRILAITFSNDATAEMKNRILDFLREASLRSLSPEKNQFLNAESEERNRILFAYLKEIFKDIADEKTLLENIRELYEDIISDYDSFTIQTIDSLLTGIADSLSSAIKGASPGSKNLILNEEPLFKEAIARVLVKSEKERELFILLNEVVERELEENKEAEFNPLILVEKKLEALFRDDNDKVASSGIDITSIKASLRFLKEKTLEEARTIPELSRINSLTELITHISEKKINYTDTGKERSSKKMAVNLISDTFLSRSGKITIPKLSGEACEIRENTTALKLLVKAALLTSMESALSVLQLYKRILQEMESIKKERKQISLEDVKRNIVSAFHPESFTEKSNEQQNSAKEFSLFIFLAEKFSFFLIDEFQDTDSSQWNTLKEIISESLSSTEKSLLFVVGDRKQAIYRWKGGRVELFDEISKDLNIESANFLLRSNYRSEPEIVEFVEKVFSILSPENKEFFFPTSRKFNAQARFYPYELTDFENIYSEEKIKQFPRKQQISLPLFSQVKKSVFVHHYEDEDLILEELADVVQKEINAGRDVGILVRKREEGELIAGFLSKMKIPHAISLTPKLEDSPSVSTVLNLMLHAVENSIYSLVLVFLDPRGPFWEIPVKKKLELLKRSVDHDENLKTTIKTEHPQENELLEEIKTKIKNSRNPYEAVVAVIEALPPLQDPQSSSPLHLNTLIETALSSNNITLSLREFVEKVRSGEIEGGSLAGNIVHQKKAVIKTIHSAKGLEFTTVLIPFTAENISVRNQEKYKVVNLSRLMRLYYNPTRGTFIKTSDVAQISSLAEREILKNLPEESTIIFYIGKIKLQKGGKSRTLDLGTMSPLLAFLKHNSYFYQELESVNLLYVALTRAREKLHIWVPQNQSRSGLKWADLIRSAM